ncbi:hypothetical protein GW17_00000124 [Ensete ventricosum]|nr:hypothetical protein GW17_00000124 [Ensete ventricosum]
MLAVSKSRVVASLSASGPLLHHRPWRHLGFLRPFSSSPAPANPKPGFLELDEVEKILGDVKADDVRVISVRGQCDWTDYMVVATGRSTWHVRNIAQALIHKAGNVIVHALEEKARAYYNLESLWTTEMTPKGPNLYVPPSLPRSHTKTKLRPDHGAITFNANYGGLDRNHRSSLDSIRPSVLVLQRTVGPMNSKPITVFCTHPHGEMIL